MKYYSLKHSVISLALVAIALILAAYFYPVLPNQIASHWDASGQVNGYMPKFWGIFMVPLLMLGFFIIGVVIPYLDPFRKNIEEFRNYYELFWTGMLTFFFYIYLLMLAWNLGYVFDFVVFLVPAFAALWWLIATLLEHTKQNWFIGIRTPWTLSDERVWAKTHKLGAKLFKTGAIVMLVGILFPKFIVSFFVAAIVLSAVVPVVYSFVEYRRLHKGQ
jgi:uncharacterized membrane protein